VNKYRSIDDDAPEDSYRDFRIKWEIKISNALNHPARTKLYIRWTPDDEYGLPPKCSVNVRFRRPPGPELDLDNNPVLQEFCDQTDSDLLLDYGANEDVCQSYWDDEATYWPSYR